MKYTRVCCKCKSNNIVRFEGNTGPYGANQLFVGTFSTVNISKYVCCDCGYVEEWIDYEEDIAKIKTSHRAKR